MATIVKEPWLNCKRFGRWRRKKFIAIVLFAFFLIVLVSCLASGKSSRKLHKNIHQLEEKFENLEKTYTNKVWAFQRDIEALKLERKSLSQTPSTKQSGNVTSSSETEKGLADLQQQLKQTQEEMKEQNESIKSFVKMFESYKEETSKELSELKSMRINDQQEIQRLQNAIKQLEVQKHEDNVHQKTSENKTVNEKKEFKNDPAQVQIQSKNAPSPPLPPETRPKPNSNILARGAKAVKEYVSNLAFKLNPFRSSRDKTPNNKPVSQENKIPVAVEGTIKKSVESVKSEPSQAEKNFAWLKNHIEVTLESVISLLDNAVSLDNPIEMLKKIESKFNHLEKAVVDYGSTKLLNAKDQERVLKWKKNFLPIKEQFEKILHDNMTHGSKSHKHSSKNLQKLTNTTRHLKDTLL